MINLKQELKNLAGETLKSGTDNLTLGEALANIIVSAEESGKMKLYILAQKCYKEDNIDLDASDLALVKKVVGTTKIYSALVSGQVELLLEDVKKEEKKEEKKK